MLGDRIKELRKERKLTIKQLSELSGVSMPTICSVEKGKSKPRLPVLKKLSVALKCEFNELYKLWN